MDERSQVRMELSVEKLKPRRLLLRPSEAADLIGCSRAKVYELIKSGAIPSVTLEDGRMIRIPLAALEKLASVPE
jgi:excisionase family DNA binding protein